METDEATKRLIGRAIERARERGRDYLGQAEEAVRELQSIDPGLDSGEAHKIVERLRPEM